jgi:hypothetical protein
MAALWSFKISFALERGQTLSSNLAFQKSGPNLQVGTIFAIQFAYVTNMYNTNKVLIVTAYFARSFPKPH